MDRTAIEKIEHLATAANAIPAELAHRITVVDGKVVDLEPYASKRARYRAHYNTHAIDDFVTYEKAHNKDGAAVYVDADKMAATVRFNLGDESNPGHGDDRATLALRITPEWAALSGRQEWLSQQDAVLFLQDWSFVFVSGTDEAGEHMSLNEVAAAIRRIKVDATNTTDTTVKNFGGTRSALEDVQVSTRMVDRIQFTVVPYTGLPEIAVEVQVQLALNPGRPPQVKFRLLQAEAWKDRNAQAFASLLDAKLDSAVLAGTLTI